MINKLREEIYVKRNTEARLCNYCYCGKAMSIPCSECVLVASVSQLEKRMRRTVACPALQYFSTLAHKRQGGGVTGHKMRVLIFSTTFDRNIPHFKTKFARFD